MGNFVIYRVFSPFGAGSDSIVPTIIPNPNELKFK